MKYVHFKIGGLLLGVVSFMSVLLYKPLGISTQFSVLGGIIQNTISPIVQKNILSKHGYSSTIEYYDKDGGKLAADIANPINAGMMFFVCTMIGGVGSTIVMRKKQKMNQVYQVNFSKKQLLAAFISGFLLVLGARIAGGCTSGHMMSGLMQGSLGSYVFTIVVFAVAIPVALRKSFIKGHK